MRIPDNATDVFHYVHCASLAQSLNSIAKGGSLCLIDDDDMVVAEYSLSGNEFIPIQDATGFWIIFHSEADPVLFDAGEGIYIDLVTTHGDLVFSERYNPVSKTKCGFGLCIEIKRNGLSYN